MAGPFVRAWAAVTFVLVAAAPACRSDASDVTRHRRALRSLASSATTAAEGWLDGTLSSRSAGTDLDKLFSLLQEERGALADDPARLGTEPFAALAREADADARLFALLIHDIAASDRNALRRHLAASAPGAAR